MIRLVAWFVVRGSCRRSFRTRGSGSGSKPTFAKLIPSPMIRRRLHFFRGGSTECFAILHSALHSLRVRYALLQSQSRSVIKRVSHQGGDFLEQAAASPPVKPEGREPGPAPER